MDWTIIAGAWAVLMVTTGWVASSRGHSVVSWLVIALLLTPVVALIMLVATPAKSTDP
jgi:hypothetical protein